MLSQGSGRSPEGPSVSGRYAFYGLAADIGEQKNLVDDPNQAEQIQRSLGVYRDIRAPMRSMRLIGAAE